MFVEDLIKLLTAQNPKAEVHIEAGLFRKIPDAVMSGKGIRYHCDPVSPAHETLEDYELCLITTKWIP